MKYSEIIIDALTKRSPSVIRHIIIKKNSVYAVYIYTRTHTYTHPKQRRKIKQVKGLEIQEQSILKKEKKRKDIYNKTKLKYIK